MNKSVYFSTKFHLQYIVRTFLKVCMNCLIFIKLSCIFFQFINRNIIMEKQQVVDSQREIEQSSSEQIESEKMDESIESDCLEENKQPIHNQILNHDYQKLPQPQPLKQDKEFLIRQLLNTLGYQNTIQTFQIQCRSAKGDKNPEQASNQKRVINKKKRDFGANYFRELIQSSENYDEMVQTLEEMYNHNYELTYEDVEMNMQQRALHLDFQKRIKSLYSSKKQATIPKHKNIEILLEGKEVKFIDVSADEKLCLLDSEDYLRIITVKGEVKPIKMDEPDDIVYLKWVNQSTIFSINVNGKVSVFSHEQNEVKLKETIPLKMPKIKRINVIIMKYPERPDKEYVRILSYNENKEFIACQIVVHQGTVKFTGGTLFHTNHYFKAFNLLKVPKINLNQEKIDCEQNYKPLIDSEHYYGLADNARSIIKFDTLVKKQGVLWTANKKIDSMSNSKCRYFLILLLTECSQRKIKLRSARQKKNGRTQMIYNSQFVKMNGHGCIIERIPVDFQSPFLPEGLTLNLSRMRLMDPDWLACFDWEDSIIYISIKSGKILHIQDLEEDVRVIGVGPSNCLVCSADEKIFMLSIKQHEKRRVILENKPAMRDRESLILRLTRNGIPETLLQLLQELRNNQIELIES